MPVYELLGGPLDGLKRDIPRHWGPVINAPVDDPDAYARAYKAGQPLPEPPRIVQYRFEIRYCCSKRCGWWRVLVYTGCHEGTLGVPRSS